MKKIIFALIFFSGSCFGQHGGFNRDEFRRYKIEAMKTFTAEEKNVFAEKECDALMAFRSSIRENYMYEYKGQLSENEAALRGKNMSIRFIGEINAREDILSPWGFWILDEINANIRKSVVSGAFLVGDEYYAREERARNSCLLLVADYVRALTSDPKDLKIDHSKK